MQHSNKKNKNLNFAFLIFIISITLNFVFFNLGLSKVYAEDEIYCTVDDVDNSNGGMGDCESNAEDCGWPFCSGKTSTCTVNGPNKKVESGIPAFTGTGGCYWESISDPKTRKCRTGACPDSNSPGNAAIGIGLVDGDVCVVRVLSGTAVLEVSGLWDANEHKCIGNCGGTGIETSVCGTTSSLSINASSCTGDGDNEFELGCGDGVSDLCDEHIEDYACDTGKTCNSSGQCAATAACGTNPQITASPTTRSASAGDSETYTITIKNNDETGCSDRTFKLTASGPIGWPTISLDKIFTASLSPGGSETATLTVKSKSPENDGIYVISVIAEDSADSAKKSSVSVDYVIGALACPSNYKVEFTSAKISNEDNYKLNITTDGSETGEVCVYRYPISNIARDMEISPSTFGLPLLPMTSCGNLGGFRCTNYDTGTNTGSYGFGTYRVTINPDSTSCNYNSPCFDTVEVVDCINNADCTAPATCVGNTCVIAGGGTPACAQTSCGGAVSNQPCMCGAQLVSANGDYCCAVSNYYGNETTCKNASNCNIAAICDDDNVKDAGEECDGTDLDGKTCADFGFVGGILACSSCVFDTSGCADYVPPVCDPDAWFFCNTLEGTVDDIFQAGETMIGYILGLIGSVALLLIIISGVMYMTSMGNEEKITTSKKILTGAVIGLAIALLSYSLLQLVISIL